MRGTTDEPLRTSAPLLGMLPSMLQGDDFCRRFTEGLDGVLAPTLWTLDSLDGYTDPWTAPDDFLQWLASWFGWDIDRHWPERRRRAVVAKAVDLHRWRGTVFGVSLLIELYTDIQPEIIDGGGTWVTIDPSESLPGETLDAIVLRIPTDDPDSIDESRLFRLLRSVIPAHLTVVLQIG